jgi:MinD-like ATPase involved in chromosome partitioning or flagellar assembly
MSTAQDPAQIQHLYAHPAPDYDLTVEKGVFEAPREVFGGSAIEIPSVQKLARIHGVLGTSGGIGASTFSAALAAYLHQNVTVLVDLQFSGGIDATVGIEQAQGVRWADVLNYQMQSDVLLGKLPKWGQIHVLSNKYEAPECNSIEKVHYTIAQLAAKANEIVLDIPRTLIQTGEIFEQLDSLTILVPRNVQGISNALAVVSAVRPYNLEIRVITTTERMNKRSKHIGRDVVQKLLGVPICAELRFENKTMMDLELGLGPRISKKSHLFRVLERLDLRRGNG